MFAEHLDTACQGPSWCEALVPLGSSEQNTEPAALSLQVPVLGYLSLRHHSSASGSSCQDSRALWIPPFSPELAVLVLLSPCPCQLTVLLSFRRPQKLCPWFQSRLQAVPGQWGVGFTCLYVPAKQQKLIFVGFFFSSTSHMSCSALCQPVLKVLLLEYCPCNPQQLRLWGTSPLEVRA